MSPRPSASGFNLCMTHSMMMININLTLYIKIYIGKKLTTDLQV